MYLIVAGAILLAAALVCWSLYDLADRLTAPKLNYTFRDDLRAPERLRGKEVVTVLLHNRAPLPTQVVSARYRVVANDGAEWKDLSGRALVELLAVAFDMVLDRDYMFMNLTSGGTVLAAAGELRLWDVDRAAAERLSVLCLTLTCRHPIRRRRTTVKEIHVVPPGPGVQPERLPLNAARSADQLSKSGLLDEP